MVVRAGDQARPALPRIHDLQRQVDSAQDRWRRSARPGRHRSPGNRSRVRSSAPLSARGGGRFPFARKQARGERGGHELGRDDPDPLSGDVSGAARHQPRRAGAERGDLVAGAVQIRDFATDRHRSVDDTPAGGGAGMVMRADVLAAARRSCAGEAAGGADAGDDAARALLDQALVRALAAGPGRLDPVRPVRGDGRAAVRGAADRSRSRSATMCCRAARRRRSTLLDACVRLLPGVMGAASSGEEESFESGLLEYPHYTRPVDMGRAHDP